MDQHALISKSTHQVSSQLDGEVVLLDINTGDYFKIDPVGSRIWELLEEPTTLSSLCKTLTAEFDISAERCRADVTTFIEKLVSLSLVVVS